MSGGVSPWEWVMPIVGASHTAYNAAAQQGSPRAKFDAPGSKNDRRDDVNEHNRQVLGEQQAEAARRADELRYNTTPQTAQEAFASRLRAKNARQALSESGAGASTYLTSTLGG